MFLLLFHKFALTLQDLKNSDSSSSSSSSSKGQEEEEAKVGEDLVAKVMAPHRPLCFGNIESLWLA